MMKMALAFGLLLQSVAWSAEAPANFVVKWNKQLLAAAEAEDGFMTLKGVRTAAMMHLAMHAALSAIRLRAVLLVTTAVVVFAYSVHTLGLVIAAALITLIGGLASPQMRPLEMVAAAVVLAGMTTAIFVWGIGLPIPIWPEF